MRGPLDKADWQVSLILMRSYQMNTMYRFLHCTLHVHKQVKHRIVQCPQSLQRITILGLKLFYFVLFGLWWSFDEKKTATRPMVNMHIRNRQCVWVTYWCHCHALCGLHQCNNLRLVRRTRFVYSYDLFAAGCRRELRSGCTQDRSWPARSGIRNLYCVICELENIWICLRIKCHRVSRFPW